ncbi:Arginine--tRNA ligase [bacterium HR35]|nr:Arginine--tRNA ligase [bacterium HR35]
MQLIDLYRKTKLILKKELSPADYLALEKDLKFFLTKDENFGDYSTNLLFLLKKIKPEKEEVILETIKNKFKNYFDRIEVEGGYLNFYLGEKVLFEDLREILKKRYKFFFSLFKKQRVVLDYVSANPTGPLHLGNIRSAVLGDSLANFLKLLGFKVTKEYYVNDRGTQIEILAKSAKAYLNLLPFEDEYYRGEYLEKIAQKYKDYVKKEENFEKLGKFLAKIILEGEIKKSLKRLGTKFDNYFFESSLYQDKKLIDRVLKIFEKKNLLEKKNGALILKLTKVGENKDEFLIRENGKPTYFFSDILYHYQKFFIRKFKLLIDIFGADHHDHIRRLKKTLEILGIKEKNLKFITYQHVLIKRGEEILRMSKRKGVYITIDELLDVLPSGLVRFLFLAITPDSPLEFDLELALKKSEENPYWYSQYASARLNSILEKLKEKGYKINIKLDPQKIASHLIKDELIKNLVRSFHKFKDLNLIIIKELKPNLYYDFFLNFIKKIHYFYENKKIIREEIDRREVVFVKTLRDVLGFWFKLMGVEPMKKI